MRFGFASPLPPAPPLSINLAADDTEDDDDLEPPRPVVLPRPRSAQQSPSPRVSVAAPSAGKRPAPKSRKRSLEQASRSGSDAISSSDDSGAEAQKPRVSTLEAVAGDVDVNGRGNSFLTPSPVRIARRKRQGLHFFMDMNSRQRALHEQQTSGGESDAESVCAARTLVCSQRFGRCEMHFGADQVDLLLWKPASVGGETRVWQGTIKYGQLARFWYGQDIVSTHTDGRFSSNSGCVCVWQSVEWRARAVPVVAGD